MVTTRGKKIEFMRESSLDDQPEDVDEPPRKKLKRSRKLNDTAYVGGKSTANKKGKGRRGGRLRDLMNMPIDIFTEICSYLAPKDLRSLSLTTRRLREILMSKDSKHIWKTVLATETELPECPTDLNEPKYVALLFGIHCFGCGSRFGTRVDYFHRVRYCPSCYQQYMLRERDATREWCDRVGPFSLHFLNMLSSIDYDSPFESPRLVKQDNRPILRSAFYETLDRYSELKNAPDNKDLLKAFEAELLQQCEARRETTIEIDEWAEEKADERTEELETIKMTRRNDIQERLVNLGWDSKDMPIFKREFRSLVYKAQPLTDRIWQNLLPKLLPFMELGKLERLQREKRHRRNNRETMLTARYEQLIQDLLPDIPKSMLMDAMIARDFLDFPAINALLEEDTEDINDSQWESVVGDVSPFALSKVEECVHRVARCLGSADSCTGKNVIDRINSMAVAVSNVSAVAWCPDCNEPIRSPRIFGHIRYHRFQGSDILDRIVEDPMSGFLQDIATQALHDCGLDPGTKWADIEDSTTFVCARCDPMVARHGTFNDILSHYMRVQRWFAKASEALNQDLPLESRQIINDHALEDDDPVMVRESQDGIESILEAQAGFAYLERVDARNDGLGEGGDEFERDFLGRRILRNCILCPTGYSPSPDTVGWLELHARDKHGIHAFDVDQHTAKHTSILDWAAGWVWTNGEGIPCPR